MTAQDDRRLLLDASGEILLLLDAATLVIVDANAGATALLGWPREALLGQPIGEFECALSDMFFWDDMAARESAEGVESALRCADGAVLDVGKTVRRVAGPTPRYTLRAIPVAAGNRIEAELASMGSRLRATLEATADGILLVDSDGAILNMNQRFSSMWRLPEKLLLRRDDAAIMRFIAAQRRPAQAADATGMETISLLDGRVFECRSHDARSGEEVIGRVFSYRDVTERVRTLQELEMARDAARQASVAKGEFLAMMSHEIRTPMNGVLGIAELLAGTRLSAEQADYVRTIRASGETLLAIINDILDFSKIEAGKMTLEAAPFALPALVDEIAALFRHRLRDDGPVLACTIADEISGRLVGDPVRLRQVLFNLVGNAFKFTERGRIEVHVAPAALAPGAVPPPLYFAGDGTPLRFEVRDTGIGLTAEQAGRLFRSFEQADSSTTRKYGGTGLGLAICKRLVELMGGEIGVVSTPGAGSTFWFTAWFGTAAAPQAQAAAAAAAALDAGTRVLLVEDNLVNRKVVAGMLGKLGGSAPTLAGNGAEAVEAALAAAFDVILMDTQMPVMDGLEATRRLRAAGVRTPIVGVSAGALDEERAAALAAGMDDYVLKPVSAASLGAALARALGK